ncbi:MAG: acyltransferase family protein, partial [Bdellovibrionales bacterium]
MNTPLGSKKTSFDHRIESLRGLAALAVVVTHSSAVLQVDHSPAFWQLSLLKQSLSQQLLTLLVAFFSSGAAVILFFVLSGYVLTLSVCRQKSYESVRGLLSYAVRRLFRLIPPMWASIFLFWLVLEVVRTPENMSSFTLWFTSVFSVNLSAKDILENLFLIDFRANPVTW